MNIILQLLPIVVVGVVLLLLAYIAVLIRRLLKACEHLVKLLEDGRGSGADK